MHEVLRQRLMRKIEGLPDDQIYQVLDFIEFLEAKYGESDLEDEVTGLQRFAERLEDGLRKRTVRPGTLREAFQLISAADRVLSGVASAGREMLDELNVEPGSSGRKPLDPPDPGTRRASRPPEDGSGRGGTPEG